MNPLSFSPVKSIDVLLADDDIDDVFIFEAALKELGLPYRLRHADNGDVLFILLKEKIPDILFLDVNIPCKDGVACVAEIRKDPAYDMLPVIMYASDLSPKILNECFGHGANFYLRKAHTFDALKENLGKVLSIDRDKYLHYPPHEILL